MNWLDVVFPKRCVGCGKWGSYVCNQCEVGMWEEEQICPACRRNSRYGLRHDYCKNKEYLEGVNCMWAYEGVVRKIVGLIKYNFYYDYTQELYREVAERMREGPEFFELRNFVKEKPAIVPVPLFAAREKWRGFNQARNIGKWLSKNLNLEMKDILIRTKDTGQQVGRKREARLQAMEGAFQLRFKAQDSEFKIPEKVILVDDVWTTGATMQECAKVLKKVGVKKVWAWVLAR